MLARMKAAYSAAPAKSFAPLFAAVLAMPACGGGEASNSNGGGTGGTGTLPPRASVALSLTLTQAQSGHECRAATSGAVTYEIGSPSAGRLVRDGTGDVRFDCGVLSDGIYTVFIVDGVDASGGSYTLDVATPLTQAASQPERVWFFSSSTSIMVRSAEPCTFGPPSFIGYNAWTSELNCPLIYRPDAPEQGCALFGTIAVEHCND
jgi:hypothetical protein